MRARSSSVNVSWYCSGFQSPASASTSCVAMRKVLASGFDRLLGTSSMSARGTTSSAKRIVDIAKRTVERADRRQVLLVAHHDGADGDAVAVLHRRQQELVRLACRITVGRQPIRAFEVDRIDLLERHEVGHLDRLRRCRPQLVELVLVERDVATLAHLEAHLDVLVVDLPA